MVGARLLTVLELGLGDRRLVGHVPERGGFGRIRLTSGEVAEERPLACALGLGADGRVGQIPVDAEPHVAPQVLEHLLVLDGAAQAQLDEVRSRARHRTLAVRRLRWFEGGVVWERRVAPHPVVDLDATLGGQAVVVPPHRVEDLVTAHAPEPGDAVGLDVAEHRTHVQRPAHRGRRRVDAEDRLALLRPVEPVGAVGLPPLLPANLEPVEGRLLGDLGHGETLPATGRGLERATGAWVRSR